MKVALMCDSDNLEYHLKDLQLDVPIKSCGGVSKYCVIDIDIERLRELAGMSGYDFRFVICGIYEEDTDVIIEIMDLEEEQ